MSTIFPREEKAEQIFDKILENPKACDRLKNTFLRRSRQRKRVKVQELIFREPFLPQLCSMHMKTKDLSAFLMAVCNNSVFDLLGILF